VLVFTFTPNPVPSIGLSTSCSGGTTPYNTWNFNIKIQNASGVPFTLSSWTFGPGGSLTVPIDNSVFQLIFGTTTIPAGGEAQGNMCVYLTSASTGQIRYTLNGTGGNGPHTSQFLSLIPQGLAEASPFDRGPGRGVLPGVRRRPD
jgi:hypothetical protein